MAMTSPPSRQTGFAVKSPYNAWLEATGVPIYRDYFIEDLRTIKVGPWDQRECDTAFIDLVGQEGVTGAYVLEIPPGKTTKPFQVAVDDCIYVLAGRGITTLRADENGPSRTFEWDTHSLFLVPANHTYQLSNTQGNQAARVLVSNYLPLAMSVLPEPEFFFNHPLMEDRLTGEFYSEAVAHSSGPNASTASHWLGNFFPDLRAWDKLDTMAFRGAGGRAVMIEFPGSPVTAHMSVFPSRTYKKAHRHGPGYIIVIPAGEGYSIMWPQNGEKIVIPWHEGSCFVPPRRWFHQHFNVSEHFDRYLAIHPPEKFQGQGEKLEDPIADQIEYTEEEQLIRLRFSDELTKRGLTSLIPEEAYTDPDYTFAVRTS